MPLRLPSIVQTLFFGIIWLTKMKKDKTWTKSIHGVRLSTIDDGRIKDKWKVLQKSC